jgi:hypothetical protein
MMSMFNVMLFWPALLVQTALALAAALGALQAATLRNDLAGLAWPIGLRHKRWGYFLAVLMMMTALVGEVILLLLDVDLNPAWWILSMLVGSVLALMVSIVGAALGLRWNKVWKEPSEWGNTVELGPLRATFYRPAGSGPFPAVCLLPDPTAPGDDLTPLVQALVEGSIAVMALDWELSDDSEQLTLQGLASVGISHLAERAETDAERVGVVGVGLGGDLALKGAAMDAGVAAVLAMEPVLSTRRPIEGVRMLRALSWFEARARARRWRRSPLIKDLDAMAAIPRLAPRPAAVVVGAAGSPDSVGPVEILRVTGGCPLTPVTHKEAVRYAAQWLMEYLV